MKKEIKPKESKNRKHDAETSLIEVGHRQWKQEVVDRKRCAEEWWDQIEVGKGDWNSWKKSKVCFLHVISHRALS